MTQEQKDVKEFMTKAGQAMPNKPTIPDAKTRVLRIRLLLEELLELAEASGVQLSTTDGVPLDCMDDFAFDGLPDTDVDLVEVVDALTDSQYVNLGAALAFGIDLEDCHKLVHESNLAKFSKGGYRDEAGKWRKPPDWVAPDLESEINRQSGKVNTPMPSTRVLNIAGNPIDQIPFIGLNYTEGVRYLEQLGYEVDTILEGDSGIRTMIARRENQVTLYAKGGKITKITN